ncbi:uncharacterized protein DUF5050 [Ureibacillus xyleni]|uniref:Uncharacterized protein DUF5050 n=1 Tax=Ureibacillus xyleni TaxID=614648 RepID=A0A285R9P1_9BACL|nr:transglutaminase domain-containing protein [Ureibacillus xyleni]SOB90771.1 uncharacterized protein DUF5050 [Ureibacillus xyleni]
MDQRKIVIATIMAISMSPVIVAETHASDNHLIIENSGTIINPNLMGAKVAETKSVATVSNLAATNITDLTSILENELSKRSTAISIKYTGDTTNILEKVNEIIKNYGFKDDYFRGILSKWQYGTYGYENNVTITVNLTYLTTPQQEAFIQSEVERIVDSIIKPSMSVVEKVKAINDYVVLNTTYSFDSSTTPHAAYAILNEGKGVCQAYALLTLRLLQEAGIEAKYVTGESRGEGHAWNLVKIDGQWYHLDTTWNDPVFADSSVDHSDYVQYKYFLITDSAIREDHTIDNHGYPTATSERFMAFRYIEEPVQVGSTLYFPNQLSNYQLYKLDMTKEPLKVEKVSSTRVQYIVPVDGWLYFSNYSFNAFLAKMKLDGSEEKILLEKRVDSVRLEGNEIVASFGGVELYREVVMDAVVVGQQEEIQQIRSILNSIEFLSPNFEAQAIQLKALYNILNEDSRLLLSNSERATIQSILSKYETMKNLTFDTIQWETARKITNPKKEWKINLNQEVANTAANKSQIRIVDMFGESISATVTINGKQIVVTPLNEYVANVPYTLIVDKGLLSVDGTKVKNGVHLEFELN